MTRALILISALIPAQIPGSALAEARCPAGADISAPLTALIEEGQAATKYMPARDALRDMWALYRAAPDAWSGELMDLGLERARIADYEGAKKAFDLLVVYCPTWAEGWNQRAFVAFQQEDYASALADVERALALEPRHIPALSGKGVTLMRLGRQDEGEAVLRAAVDLHPWLPERGLLPDLYGAPR